MSLWRVLRSLRRALNIPSKSYTRCRWWGGWWATSARIFRVYIVQSLAPVVWIWGRGILTFFPLGMAPGT